jgi:hypothetical protein
MRRARGNRESGFALLFVFALAAIVALMLYLELPRVAFEAQRGKEDLLIQRGEQYQRAIKLFVRRFNRYPGSIEQLENTNNIRFLRRRYKDPMTGKDEWRLIHSVGGAFPDSLTQKGPAIKGAVDVSQLGGDSSGGDNPAPPPLGWRRSRSGQRSGGVQLASPPGVETGSEDTSGQQPAGYPPPATPSGEPDASGSQPGQQPAYPGQAPPPGFPGQPAALGGVVPGQPLTPDQAVPGQVVPPGQLFPGQPLQRGSAFPGQLPYAQQPLNPQQQGQDVGGINVTGGLANPAPAGLQHGAQSLQPSDNPALDVIRRQLTGGSTGFAGNPNLGGGIAGVASKSEGEGIKVYNDHTKYKEWEFIYDPRKDLTAPLAGAVPAVPSMPTAPAGTVKAGTGQN